MAAALQQGARNRRNNNRQQNMSSRGAYPSQNNYSRRETPEPEPPNSSSPIRGLYRDQRTAVVMCSFMGTRTTVKTRNGSTYKGHTTGFSDKGDIAMSDAKLDDDDSTSNPNLSGIIIPKDSFVVCKTNGVDLKGLCATADFTDSGIVGRMNGSSEGQLKELQPWQDDEAADVNSPSMSLDDPTGGWDSHSMFQVNTEKFNVQSSYNENMHEYTTKLPDPQSEGYEEREKLAQKQAEEIERSETYQNRIAKELTDGDEESRYSAVHRPGDAHGSHRSHDGNTSSGKNTYTIPALRGDGDPALRNGNMTKGSVRGQQRQPLPYSSASHPQQQQQQHPPHHMVQNTRQINNHYQGPPPSGGHLNRNQGPMPMHTRQQQQSSQNHAAPPPQQYHQQPPPPHPGMQQPPQHQQSPVASQQQQRPSTHHPMVSSQHPNKSHMPPPHQQVVPLSLSNSLPPQQQQQPPPPQAQHPSQKMSPAHSQAPTQQPPMSKGIPPSVNGPSGPPPPSSQLRQPMPMKVNGAPADAQNVEALAQKVGPVDLNPQGYHQQLPVSASLPVPSSAPTQKVSESPLSASSSSSSLVDSQQLAQKNPTSATSPPAAVAADRRVGRGMEMNTEEQRNKIGQSLHDFQKKFVLESNGASSQEPPRQEDNAETTPASSAPSIPATPVSSAAEAAARPVEPKIEAPPKPADKPEEEGPAVKSKLNPNAKEFKPKSQPLPVETQSTSPQPRCSPLATIPVFPHHPPHAQQTVLVPYPHPHHAQYLISNQMNQQRKRATVSLNGSGVTGVDITAHQVTGQPLLATQHPSMVVLSNAGYHQMINPRMVGPTGQVTGLEQSQQQNQPQPVFVNQQQPVHTPIQAHMPPTPHAQPMPHPTSNQQPTPAHGPNPAPSPVQHQQHTSQPIPQPMPHHLSQGPPQSATPQPAHFPQMSMSYSHAIPTVPRTSMSGQQSMAAGHPTVSISYPLMSAPQYNSYPNGSTAQYTFATAAQPQTSQNSSHGPGPQPQYVVMPPTQGHPPMQQHTNQPYTAAGIPFQPQNIMQGRTTNSGPPQMPPNPNHNQGGHPLMHSAMQANIHQQVPGTQAGMYMHVPSTLQQFQHPQ